MTKREQLARTADKAWLDALEECQAAGAKAYTRDILRSRILPAILAELREPDDRMTDAGVAYMASDTGLISKNARQFWQAMIDAIE